MNPGVRKTSRPLTAQKMPSIDRNDGLTIAGAFYLPVGKSFADLDPLNDGARIVLKNGLGGTESNIVLPGGAYGGSRTRGWRLTDQGRTWTYSDTTSPPGAIATVHFYDRNSTAPRRVEVTVSGDKGTYPVAPGDEPVNAIVVLGGQVEAAAGLCAESTFVLTECVWNLSLRQLTCRK
jgi:hypothetical protein